MAKFQSDSFNRRGDTKLQFKFQTVILFIVKNMFPLMQFYETLPKDSPYEVV